MDSQIKFIDDNIVAQITKRPSRILKINKPVPN